MKNLLYILLMLLPVSLKAQDTLKYQVSIGAGGNLNKLLAYGADINIRYYFTDRFYGDASTFHAILKQFDPYRNYSDASLNSGARLPVYNQSSLMIGYDFIDARNTLGKNTRLGIRGGYFYYQQTISEFSSSYNTIDTTATGGELMICGTMVHAGFIGLELNTFKSKSRGSKLQSIFQHRAYADFLYGFRVNTSGIRREGNQYSAYEIPNQYDLHKAGMRVGYAFTHVFSKKLGYTVGAEIAYRPTIDYTPNRAFYIPRGGESFFPFQISCKAALTFMGLKKRIQP